MRKFVVEFDGYTPKTIEPIEQALAEAFQNVLHVGESKCEHCDEYKRGLDDGKNSIDKGCEGCRYESNTSHDEPCCNCCKAYLNKYEPLQKDDSIKVGDEVINNTTGTKGILLEPETENLLATVIVPNQRCDTFHISHNNLTKTGRHFPQVVELLKAMKEGAE